MATIRLAKPGVPLYNPKSVRADCTTSPLTWPQGCDLNDDGDDANPTKAIDTMTPTYLDNSTYHALVAALAKPLPACPVTGTPDAEAIKLRLGEVGNIWPASILPDDR